MDPRLLDAARYGDVDLLKKIEEENADLRRGVTPFGNTARHIAVTFKQQEFVEEICARKPALLRVRNQNGETPLHAAAILGSHRVVVLFLGLAPAIDVWRGDVKELLRAVDRYRNNALHSALRNGHAKAGLLHKRTRGDSLSGHDEGISCDRAAPSAMRSLRP
ncbi:protein ACCELERATED CELL DEATH 6-like [Elaeis guineensis]|uniref:Uncharacterized protein LOC109506523 n=1 Tax=Elaeis guineensis var. tenera TaxID=51953 RepID=A0A6J0PQL2_ELAGV|nr:uncharacterized protein LOC109506523 [Elaeis guineensis]